MQPITVTIRDARQMSGIGTTKLYELISLGKLETVTVGRRRLVKVQSLRQILGEAA